MPANNEMHGTPHAYLSCIVAGRTTASMDVKRHSTGARDLNAVVRPPNLSGQKNGLFFLGLVLYSANGSPMRGAPMLATLQRLAPSFSQPRVSNAGSFSESLSRTLKYCPEYPNRKSADLLGSSQLRRQHP